jgi:hypothetical protein
VVEVKEEEGGNLLRVFLVGGGVLICSGNKEAEDFLAGAFFRWELSGFVPSALRFVVLLLFCVVLVVTGVALALR